MCVCWALSIALAAGYAQLKIDLSTCKRRFDIVSTARKEVNFRKIPSQAHIKTCKVLKNTENPSMKADLAFSNAFWSNVKRKLVVKPDHFP